MEGQMSQEQQVVHVHHFFSGPVQPEQQQAFFGMLPQHGVMLYAADGQQQLAFPAPTPQVLQAVMAPFPVFRPMAIAASAPTQGTWTRPPTAEGSRLRPDAAPFVPRARGVVAQNQQLRGQGAPARPSLRLPFQHAPVIPLPSHRQRTPSPTYDIDLRFAFPTTAENGVQVNVPRVFQSAEEISLAKRRPPHGINLRTLPAILQVQFLDSDREQLADAASFLFGRSISQRLELVQTFNKARNGNFTALSRAWNIVPPRFIFGMSQLAYRLGPFNNDIFRHQERFRKEVEYITGSTLRFAAPTPRVLAPQHTPAVAVADPLPVMVPSNPEQAESPMPSLSNGTASSLDDLSPEDSFEFEDMELEVDLPRRHFANTKQFSAYLAAKNKYFSDKVAKAKEE